MGYVSDCRINSPQAICPVTGRISSALGETGVNLVDEFNSECTDSQLNAEHWFAHIKKLYGAHVDK